MNDVGSKPGAKRNDMEAAEIPTLSPRLSDFPIGNLRRPSRTGPIGIDANFGYIGTHLGRLEAVQIRDERLLVRRTQRGAEFVPLSAAARSGGVQGERAEWELRRPLGRR